MNGMCPGAARESGGSGAAGIHPSRCHCLRVDGFLPPSRIHAGFGDSGAG